MKLYILVGPSASGKTTIMEKLMERYTEQYQIVPSVTTRVKRDETSDRSYQFTTRKDFEKRIQSGDMVEWSEYAGNYYGTSQSSIDFRSKKIMLKAMDMHGALKMKQAFPPACILFVYRDKKEVIAEIMKRDIPKTDKENRIASLDDEYFNLIYCDAVLDNQGDIRETVRTFHETVNHTEYQFEDKLRYARMYAAK